MASNDHPHATAAPGAERFLNRELSLLAFQRRVLEQAHDQRHPLLERVKFLAIVGSNLDEFASVRLAGLEHQVEVGIHAATPDGLEPAEQLELARLELHRIQAEAQRILEEELLPALAAAGIDVCSWADLAEEERRTASAIFAREIFPVLTPLAIDPSHPFPHISSRSLNLVVEIDDGSGDRKYARIKMPATLPRLVALPGGRRRRLVWIEDLVAANLGALFPCLRIEQAHPFRVLRDADLDIQEDEAADLLLSIEQSVRRRFFGEAVTLELGTAMPLQLRTRLQESLGLDESHVTESRGRLGLHGLFEIAALDRADLHHPPATPAIPPELAGEDDVFSVLRRQDVLLHHPYDSFDPVVDFLRAAAEDPDVLTIKQTLYRVGRNSPIVEALKRARTKGKQVAVLVELKARFDEERNIEWARALERAGVHVVYGLIGLKTHCKVALVVRRERDGLRRYAHVGTGNYNPGTATGYTDLGLLTADPAIGADASELFNALTGYSGQRRYRKMLVAPVSLREELVARIEREVEHAQQGRGGRLVFKMNSLVDMGMIDALYAASRAGVKVDLIVRGVCCLRPGVPGLSETIRVRSLVGRFLEHPRIYWFRNGGDEELYMGSADLMRRNLDRRVEVLVPVESPPLRRYLVEQVLEAGLADTVNASELQSDGSWARVGGAPFDSQQALIRRHREAADRGLAMSRTGHRSVPPESSDEGGLDLDVAAEPVPDTLRRAH